MPRICQTPSCAILALALSSLATVAVAQVSAGPQMPDAGQVLREVQAAPVFTPPKAHLLPEVSAVAQAESPAAERVLIQSVTLVGNRELPTTELEPLVASLMGSEQTLGQLNAAVQRITDHYRQRGYLVARAYLPEQDITHGGVTIGIIEGRIASYRIDNRSRLSDTRANTYWGQTGTGEVIQAEQVDRSLLLLQDTPGVGHARAALQPGASVGTSDLLVELDPSQAYAAGAEADNYGGRYTGKSRLGVALAMNSPMGWGDLLKLNALSSGPNLSYARLAYQLPVGGRGLKLGAAYSDTRYQLGQEFAALQAHGTANSASVYATYPFVRSQTSNLSGTVMLEDKQLLDQTDASLLRLDKQVQLLSLGLAGSRPDTWGGGGLTALELTLVSGHLGMDAASLKLDATTAQSKGEFNKLTYMLTRTQNLSAENSLELRLSGQRANKNLNSSEKFSLGGADSVRAYPQGEGNGDQGWLFSLELRRSLAENLQGSLFYDAGSVAVNRNPYAAGENHRFVAGLGLGMNGQWRNLQFKTVMAWPTSGGDANSEPVGASQRPRLWVQLKLPLL
nr:ShlB/FhaC/HecB family hemolysin secretion/activation protein [uncultured Rhodoferax sp.]